MDRYVCLVLPVESCERLLELRFVWVPVLGKQVGWTPWWWNLERPCGKTGGIDCCHDSPIKSTEPLFLPYCCNRASE